MSEAKENVTREKLVEEIEATEHSVRDKRIALRTKLSQAVDNLRDHLSELAPMGEYRIVSDFREDYHRIMISLSIDHPDHEPKSSAGGIFATDFQVEWEFGPFVNEEETGKPQLSNGSIGHHNSYHYLLSDVIYGEVARLLLTGDIYSIPNMGDAISLARDLSQDREKLDFLISKEKSLKKKEEEKRREEISRNLQPQQMFFNPTDMGKGEWERAVIHKVNPKTVDVEWIQNKGSVDTSRRARINRDELARILVSSKSYLL